MSPLLLYERRNIWITNLRKQPVMVCILHKQASFISTDAFYTVNLKLLSLCSVTFLSLAFVEMNISLVIPCASKCTLAVSRWLSCIKPVTRQSLIFDYTLIYSYGLFFCFGDHEPNTAVLKLIEKVRLPQFKVIAYLNVRQIFNQLKYSLWLL